MFKRITITAFWLVFTIINISPQVKLNVDVLKKGVPVSPTHYGIFFEDINHAADGGLYAELIRNRSFEDATTPEYWTSVNQTGAQSAVSLETTAENLMNQAQTRALKLTITRATATANAGVANTGYWGINVVSGRKYTLSFFAKCNAAFTGNITAVLESATSVKYAQATITGLTSEWKKYTCTFTATGDNPNARFALYASSIGVVWFDVVSLFPPTFNDRPNGCRPELAQLLADLHPRFMRFPGGCFVEGDYLANRFQWKNTIGPIENRPGHYNLWGYRASDGLGFHEYLQLSEDIGAKPLYVANVGLAHNDNQPYTALDGYIQDALDALEYANGDVTSTYGAMRAANGHPAPFNIEYIEIGNENYHGDNYGNRYIRFYNAIKARYPNIKCIGNVAAWGTDTPAWTFSYPVDLLDEHYYRDPAWFVGQYNKYDSYNRSGPQIYVGEYAVTSNCGNGNLSAALGEAVYMCGMEKNTDIVTMNSYAPIFVNVNDRKWNPDMIQYNASTVACTPSYYVQKLFAGNIGTVTIPVTDTQNQYVTPIDGTGNIGLGTWSTQSDYTALKVTDKKGATLIAEPFTSLANWNAGSGSWTLTDTVYSQTSGSTDCRSVQKTPIADSTYTYTLKARRTSGNEGFLIIFGYKDSNNFYWWNIGGWNNTKHAIEQCVNGTKTTVASASGSIANNTWYNIRIEVSPDKVQCYLNDKLIHSLSKSVSQLLYTSATLDENSNQLYIKVVNPNNVSVNSGLLLKNIKTGNIGIEHTVLTSASSQDENPINNPFNVIPQVSSSVSPNGNLNFNFLPNSVNVLKLSLPGTELSAPTVKPDANDLKVYPNPSKNNIRVIGKNNEPMLVKIKNMNGLLVFDRQISSNDVIDLKNFTPGVYIVSAMSNKKTVSEKIVVQ